MTTHTITLTLTDVPGTDATVKELMSEIEDLVVEGFDINSDTFDITWERTS